MLQCSVGDGRERRRFCARRGTLAASVTQYSQCRHTVKAKVSAVNDGDGRVLRCERVEGRDGACAERGRGQQAAAEAMSFYTLGRASRHVQAAFHEADGPPHRSLNLTRRRSTTADRRAAPHQVAPEHQSFTRNCAVIPLREPAVAHNLFARLRPRVPLGRCNPEPARKNAPRTSATQRILPASVLITSTRLVIESTVACLEGAAAACCAGCWTALAGCMISSGPREGIRAAERAEQRAESKPGLIVSLSLEPLTRLRSKCRWRR